MKNYQSILTLIENLINDHNCIIIPNFGGFVVNIEDFKLSKDQQKIYPRKKWIAFNERLKSDDGLLSTQWADLQKISNKEAFNEINHFSKFIKSELVKNQTLQLGNIGAFHLNSESNIIFNPNSVYNYDLSIFGLTEVNLSDVSTLKEKAKPVLVEPIHEAEIREEISLEEIENDTNRQRVILPKHYFYTILAFIFAGFSAYYLTEPNSRYVNSSFSPFTIKIAKTKKDIPSQKVAIKNSAIPKQSKVPDNPIDSTITNETANSSDKIYLIAASFLTKAKAEIAMNQLKEEGFSETEILSKKENEKFYRVSIGIKESFEEAYKDAAKLKKEKKIDIWVHKPSLL
ncbi:MAG: SPOR domain-containing protein [Aquirufa sp.]